MATRSIQSAATQVGIACQTAQEAMANAMRKIGVNRLPALVTCLAEMGFGILPQGRDDTSLLADAWGISPLQTQLAAISTCSTAGANRCALPCVPTAAAWRGANMVR